MLSLCSAAAAAAASLARPVSEESARAFFLRPSPPAFRALLQPYFRLSRQSSFAQTRLSPARLPTGTPALLSVVGKCPPAGLARPISSRVCRRACSVAAFTGRSRLLREPLAPANCILRVLSANVLPPSVCRGRMVTFAR